MNSNAFELPAPGEHIALDLPGFSICGRVVQTSADDITIHVGDGKRTSVFARLSLWPSVTRKALRGITNED